MNVKSILSRLRSGELHYVFGRFRAVRMSYSRIRRLRETGFRMSAEISGGQTLFPDIDVAQAVKSIRDDAVFLGIRLPATIVREIDAFCRSTPLFARHDPDGPTFFHHDVIRGRTPDGRPTPTGSIRDPMSCRAVRAIVEDPVLRAIARNYLGYEPDTDAPILYWSLASDFTDEERRCLKQVAIDYHYDVGGFNFVYASFYILDTDRYSGAHVMMRKSHDRKSLRMLFGSAIASESLVHQRFGRENELVIEGPAGSGFIQDAACYHRASPPTHADRLMLQIRFR
jgi:hypothetical protein